MDQKQTPTPVSGEFAPSFENLNVKAGDRDTCTPESEAAIRAIGGGVRYGKSSSIKSSGSVSIPREGGPDSTRNGA